MVGSAAFQVAQSAHGSHLHTFRTNKIQVCRVQSTWAPNRARSRKWGLCVMNGRVVTASSAAPSSSTSSLSLIEKLVPADAVREIEEPAAREMLASLKQVTLTLPRTAQQVETTFIDQGAELVQPLPPVLLIPGFDSSILEYRRLVPLLVEAGFRVLAVDLVGLGFTSREPGLDFGPLGRREHLEAFVKQYVKQPVIACGASLGGAAAIDFAVNCAEWVRAMVLIDAQGFIEGAPKLFWPLDQLGIAVLKTKPLRNMANQMSYTDKTRFATEDALRIGRLHCFARNWELASVEFLRSGGYRVSSLIGQVKQPVLILWGEDDQILELKYVDQFKQALTQAESLRVHILPECGHVPHLEKPQLTARYFSQFFD
ncbi:2-hydroxy-6-oxo-6-(2'-aminophenyl)hexa-2,4-dienoic acid hydrolase [Porphyridium purpureum]|uniref:2-hydroxy-6-oxo-6-(2'-aminophenyl)hexa-2, 4-dienoic acid hydrolase n=1 Tax=Porphyridium purpureum TaxID=35688 RepID=A0A5J4Z1X9_PORPP|nr:2-hydroxy-6-oxo-6-(2'-aminophenyl)hexa-2,4-dienoic acid hydrolase [Porphyridium purpureum]|eukprot:POR8539..scf208_2